MKRNSFFFALIFFAFQSISASTGLVYLVEIANFRDVNGLPYAEIQIDFDASTLTWTRLPNGKFSASTLTQLFVRGAKGDSSARALKIELKTPEIADTSGGP